MAERPAARAAMNWEGNTLKHAKVECWGSAEETLRRSSFCGKNGKLPKLGLFAQPVEGARRPVAEAQPSDDVESVVVEAPPSDEQAQDTEPWQPMPLEKMLIFKYGRTPECPGCVNERGHKRKVPRPGDHNSSCRARVARRLRSNPKLMARLARRGKLYDFVAMKKTASENGEYKHPFDPVLYCGRCKREKAGRDAGHHVRGNSGSHICGLIKVETATLTNLGAVRPDLVHDDDEKCPRCLQELQARAGITRKGRRAAHTCSGEWCRKVQALRENSHLRFTWSHEYIAKKTTKAAAAEELIEDTLQTEPADDGEESLEDTLQTEPIEVETGGDAGPADDGDEPILDSFGHDDETHAEAGGADHGARPVTEDVPQLRAEDASETQHPVERGAVLTKRLLELGLSQHRTKVAQYLRIQRAGQKAALVKRLLEASRLRRIESARRASMRLRRIKSAERKLAKQETRPPLTEDFPQPHVENVSETQPPVEISCDSSAAVLTKRLQELRLPIYGTKAVRFQRIERGERKLAKQKKHPQIQPQRHVPARDEAVVALLPDGDESCDVLFDYPLVRRVEQAPVRQEDNLEAAPTDDGETLRKEPIQIEAASEDAVGAAPHGHSRCSLGTTLQCLHDLGSVLAGDEHLQSDPIAGEAEPGWVEPETPAAKRPCVENARGN